MSPTSDDVGSHNSIESQLAAYGQLLEAELGTKIAPAMMRQGDGNVESEVEHIGSPRRYRLLSIAAAFVALLALSVGLPRLAGDREDPLGSPATIPPDPLGAERRAAATEECGNNASLLGQSPDQREFNLLSARSLPDPASPDIKHSFIETSLFSFTCTAHFTAGNIDLASFDGRPGPGLSFEANPIAVLSAPQSGGGEVPYWGHVQGRVSASVVAVSIISGEGSSPRAGVVQDGYFVVGGSFAEIGFAKRHTLRWRLDDGTTGEATIEKLLAAASEAARVEITADTGGNEGTDDARTAACRDSARALQNDFSDLGDIPHPILELDLSAPDLVEKVIDGSSSTGPVFAILAASTGFFQCEYPSRNVNGVSGISFSANDIRIEPAPTELVIHNLGATSRHDETAATTLGPGSFQAIGRYGSEVENIVLLTSTNREVQSSLDEGWFAVETTINTTELLFRQDLLITLTDGSTRLVAANMLEAD